MVIGKVLDTFSAKKSQSGLPRPRVNILNLIKNHGIENDKFALKDLDKTVMIVGNFAYNLSRDNSIKIEYGSLGENILFDFNPHDYKVGTQFKVGTAIIKITENCTICNHLAVFDDFLPTLVKDCRGIYCTIVKSGVIKKNDSIEVLEKG